MSVIVFNANSGSFHIYHIVNKLLVNEMMMRSVLYWANTFSWNLYCASSLKQQFADRSCRSTRTHYPDSAPTSPCSFFLMPRA